MKHTFNPKLDLKLEREIDVPAELLWKALTQAEHVKNWFAPAPWKIVDCELDLKPGGMFRSVMQSPEGQNFPNVGCFLEIVKNEKLVWTSAVQPGYRPVAKPTNGPELLFTAITYLESMGKKTKYTTFVLHAEEETCRRHDEMGFQEGWGTCLNQMIEVAKKM